MKCKSFIAILTVVIAGAVTLSSVDSASTVPSAAISPQVIELAVGEHKLWDGDYVDTTTTPQRGQSSYSYRLVTQNGGSKLRVALDLIADYRRNEDGTVYAVNEGVHPDLGSGRKFTVEIFKVDANGVETPLTINDPNAPLGYSQELFICFNSDRDGDGLIDYPDENCNPASANGVRKRDEYALALMTDSGGVWTIKVTPQQPSQTDPTAAGVTGWKFRMRAKLEGASNTQADPNELLYPNLRSQPPWELTFCEPRISVGWFAGQDPICDANSNGLTNQEELDLIAHEAATGQVKPFHRGLRFTTGPENVGEGHLDLYGTPSGTVNEDGNPVANVEQRVYRRGISYLYPKAYLSYPNAGTMDFHTSHGHWHYLFFRYTLFRVISTNRPLTKVKLGESVIGSKAGFCPSDERLADWEKFYQSPRYRRTFDRCQEDATETGTAPGLPPPNYEGVFTCLGQSCVSPTRPQMGLSSGWREYYEWQRTEQFVEFPVNLDGSPQDGLYLLRADVDSEHTLVESNENDNSSYTLFEVRGGRLTILKSGYGPEP